MKELGDKELEAVEKIFKVLIGMTYAEAQEIIKAVSLALKEHAIIEEAEY